MQPRRIWLIGGTRESRELVIAIAAQGWSCTISVTTEAARSLYPEVPELRVWIGKLNRDRMAEFLQQEQIVAILDASHPYAVEISQLAIATAQEYHLPYLRYERPAIVPDISLTSFEQVERLETLLASDRLGGERVLLTLGYRFLSHFQPWQKHATLFARILPSIPALEAAFAAGFTSDRLMAMRPPISADVEKALWQQWQISLVVTKASGTAGGEDIKQQVAEELGVKLIVIQRPEIIYPQQTNEVAIALQFCKTSLELASAS